jgi:CxxC motif-containing protein (DUF1111 family)
MTARSSIRVFAFGVVAFGTLAMAPLSERPAPDFGASLPGLTADELSRFQAGKAEFLQAETISEGVGPVFNDFSCANCHSLPAVGGSSTRVETRFGTLTATGQFDPLTQYGGSLIQSQGIGNAGSCTYVAETVPPQATIIAGRRTTPLFGLGFVDAVPDLTFRLLAAVQTLDPDGVAGVVSVVTNLSTGQLAVGKFGWKAQVPTLLQFGGDAYLNEMGITNPQFPDESCPQGDCSYLSCNPATGLNDDGEGVQKFADFMTLLAPPPRGPITVAAILGEYQFLKTGCASCHTPTLITGPSPVTALHYVAFHPYSDFLLHDMGSLGDGITQNRATGRLMRTAPLWGIRKEPSLLHDGRAATFEQAITAHDGQAKKARDRFLKLSAFEKAQLIAFLNSL